MSFGADPFSKEIQIFEAVYREGSVSGASARLSLDQGNLSRALQSLEKRLDMKLFTRHRGGVKPTFAAEEMHAALMAMGSVWDRLKNGGFSDQTTRTVKLGMHQSIAHAYLGKIMSHLSALHPEIYLDVQFGTSFEVTKKVQRRELDIGVVVNPIKSEDLVIRSFAVERIVLCGVGELGADTVLLRNPQMLFVEKVVQRMQFKRVIDIADYDVAASICLGDKRFCCIVPSTVRDRHDGLKTITELKNEIAVKFITYPGSSAVGLFSELAKACA